METLDIDISDVTNLPLAAKKLLEFAGYTKIFAIEAQMGGGKTTLIKELCRALGTTNSLSSPTYSIVNEYASAKSKIYHFDLFRIKNITELYDLGFEEYLGSDNYCFIEWPEIALGLIPKPYMSVVITLNKNNRYLRASKIK